jgi:hypothetical protein
MRRAIYSTAAVVLAGLGPWVHAQAQLAEIQQAMTSQFALTKTTADGTDIVTPGSILVLHKDGLLMFKVGIRAAPINTYKDGKLSMGFGDTLSTKLALNAAQQGANVNNVPQRRFVAGEKFWLTGLLVKDKFVAMQVYSDPYQDVRYYGLLKFPYNKKAIPSTDEVLKTIAEVVTVQPPEDSSVSDAQKENAPAPPPAAAEAPPAPPQTITLGQTKEQVVATFGQPQKVANLGAKEIFYYPDMKVTFVNGKVTDVQ